MARAIGELCQAGQVVVIDEFRYFTRASLRRFNSFLQAEVVKLRGSGGGRARARVSSDETLVASYHRRKPSAF